MANFEKKTSIGIFRALDVRIPHIDFAAAFNAFSPVFAANLNEEMKAYLKQCSVTHFDMHLQPKFFIDPVFPLLKKTDFTPLLTFSPIELDKVSRELAVFEIYEPYFFYSSQIADYAAKVKKPLITEIWTSFSGHPSLFTPPYRSFVKNVVAKTDLFIFRSKRAMSYIDSFTIPDHKKHVIYHGVNINRFTQVKKNREKLTILFVGALAAHKGLDDLLAVFPDLVGKYPNKLQLVICGDGPMRNNVINLAETLPIIYHGNVSNLQLPDIYNTADIYCQPSKDYYFFGIKGGEEFAGYTFMEALASGIPIVSTKCGGIPEIVGDENIIISQGNREELFKALDTYLKSKQLRNETGIKNRNRAETLFDITKQVKVLEKVIKDNLI